MTAGIYYRRLSCGNWSDLAEEWSTRPAQRILEYFVLPESAWWDDYYNSILKRVEPLEAKYKDNPEALEVIEMEKFEIELYRNYADYYGYVFYVMQKF